MTFSLGQKVRVGVLEGKIKGCTGKFPDGQDWYHVRLNHKWYDPLLKDWVQNLCRPEGQIQEI